MKQVQLINLKTSEVTTFPIRKSVAEYIESLNITTNSFNTISQKINYAIKNGDVIFENYKVVEITTDSPETDGEFEITFEQPAQIDVENLQTAIAETFEGNAQPVFKYERKEKSEDEIEIATEQKPNKRRNGKQVEWYVNGELQQTFSSIKACATYFKETLELKAMPFNPIMKSIRDNKDWEQNSFKFAE